MEVVLGMLLLTFSNINVGFFDRKLTWRTYSATKALSNTKKIQIINQKEFAKVVLDSDKEAFVVQIATNTSEMTIYSEQKA